MATPVPPASAPAPSFWRLLGGIYFAPGETLREVATRPRALAALLVFLLVQVAFCAVWLPRLDVAEFLRQQAEASGRPMPAGAAGGAALEAIRWTMAVSVVVATPIVLVVLAGLFLVVFNFVLGAETTFRKCLSVTGWALLAPGLVGACLMLAVMALKGDWNQQPQAVLATHLGVLLDPSTSSKALYAAATSLDLMVFWQLYLLATGLAHAARRHFSTALWAVGSLWLLFVLGKVALAALA